MATPGVNAERDVSDPQLEVPTSGAVAAPAGAVIATSPQRTWRLLYRLFR